MNLSRRAFLAGGSATLLVSGCRTCDWLGCSPNLRFGVVSDIHVTTPASSALFEKSLRYFKSRGVDAVVVPGDLTDWGLAGSLKYVREAWDRVFAGTDVVPLFCTGNHDYDGWAYSDMAVEMRANGFSGADAVVTARDAAKDNAQMAAAWQAAFGEDFDVVRLRTVKGYDFVSCEYREMEKLGEWMAAHGKRLSGDKPFFYFQHLPIKGTTCDSFVWADNGIVKPVLDRFPNAIAFTGHTHQPFVDERLIWQGTFTAISTPSLSYACFPRGDFENGGGTRAGNAKQTMPMLPMRRDLRGGQGFVVSVYEDEMVVERVDLEEDGAEGAPAWIVPLGTSAHPFDEGVRAAASVAPVFPCGATLAAETRNTENRRGFWTIVMNCEFPAATMPNGGRVHYYEITARPKDGTEPLVKKFFSPAYAKLPKYEPKRQRFWFDAKELPQGKEYVLEARAYNCFGKASKPIVSHVWKSVPEPVKNKEG